MGETIPFNIAQQTVQPVLAELTSPTPLPLAVTLVDLPLVLQSITRTIQIDGLIKNLENQLLSLRTAAGAVTLTLPSQDNFQSSQNTAIHQLMQNLISSTGEVSAKPVRLVLQPTADGVEGFLLVSPKSEEAIKQQAPINEPMGVNKTQDAFIKEDVTFAVKGKILEAHILPKEIGKIQEIVSHDEIKTLVKSDALVPKEQTQHFSSKEGQVVNASESRTKTTLPVKGEGLSQTETPALTQGLTEQKNVDKQTQGPTLIRIKIDDVSKAIEPFPPKTAPAQMRAIVYGQSPSGRTFIEAEGQFILLNAKEPLPIGTKLILQPLPLSSLELTMLPKTIESEIEALKSLVLTMNKATPTSGSLFIEQHIPSPTLNLSGTLLFLLSAIQSGKIEDWIGPRALSMIDAEHKKRLIDQLSGDVDGQPMSSDGRSGEWKSFPIPIHHNGQFDLLRLYVRNDMQKNNQSSNHPIKDKTRFVISMNMSVFGPMQMDGLSQTKRLDLVIRSENPLPQALPDEIRATYLSMMDALDMVGTISFQTGRQSWVQVEGLNSKSATLEV